MNMNGFFKLLLLTSLATLLAGCKVAVIVVQGGHVESLTNPDCLEGTICVVEVSDTNFSEQFTAVPRSGWEFVKWNTGGEFFCEDSVNPTCHLSNVGTAGNSFIEAVVASEKTFYIMPVFSQGTPITDAITVAGKEWAQADLFAEMSWSEVNAVCPGGPCVNGGTLNGYDASGWTWASLQDVGELFQATTPHPGGIGAYQTFIFPSNQWAKDFFDLYGFRPTGTLAAPFSLRETVGYVADAASDYGFVLESNVPGEPIGWAYTGEVIQQLSIIGSGVWIYRDVAP